VRVFVGLYAMEANFMAAGSAEEVVGLPLAGVAVFAFFHLRLLGNKLLLRFLLIKIIHIKKYYNS
jgi:hypothetical protein